MEKVEILDGFDTISLAELISKLALLIEAGYKSAIIETYTRYEGTTENGTYEFQFELGRLVTTE